MPNKRSVTAVVALCLGGGAAIAIPAGVAVGQSSPPSTAIIIEGHATVIDVGAAVVAKVLVACPSGGSGYVSISLTERSGNGIASGSGFRTFTCTGQIQTLTLTAPATVKPFKAGLAYAQATINYCAAVCDFANAARTVTLSTKK